jgi:hypothetical protein
MSSTAESLFDALSGAAGHPVNRSGLNAYITQGQAQAGLRTAQTNEALLNAARLQEEEAAYGRLKGNFVANGMKDSEATQAADIMRATHGTATDALNAQLLTQKSNNVGTLSDPNQLGTPAQTAAQQGIEGKVAMPVAMHPEYATLPGAFKPDVQQTPMGQATTAATNAMAGLRGAQTAAGGFNPHTGGAAGGEPDANAIEFGAYKLYKTGQMPSLGMGGGSAKMAMLAGAADLARREAAGEDVTNPGFEHALANGQDFTAGGKALGSFAAGPLGNQTRALNNVVGHLKLYDGMLSALDSGDVQLINKASAAWKKAFGSDAPTNLQAAGTLIGPELTKIMTNSNAGTGEERQSFLQTAGSLSNAPDQGHGAIRTLTSMLGRQAGDLAIQYHGATGRGDFAKRYLNPDVAGYLGLGPETGEQEAPPGAAGPGTGPAATPPTLPHAAILQLKEGYKTTFGNGQTWTLKNGQPVQVSQ